MSQDRRYANFVAKVATNLKRARIAKGLTQEDMADYGFNYRHYQKLESGRHSPNLFTLFRLSEIYGIKIEALFN